MSDDCMLAMNVFVTAHAKYLSRKARLLGCHLRAGICWLYFTEASVVLQGLSQYGNGFLAKFEAASCAGLLSAICLLPLIICLLLLTICLLPLTICLLHQSRFDLCKQRGQ